MAPSGVVHRQYWTGSIQQYLRTVRQAVERCCVIVALMSAIQAANVCVQLADVFHVWPSNTDWIQSSTGFLSGWRYSARDYRNL
jgi:hypothetical protein